MFPSFSSLGLVGSNLPISGWGTSFPFRHRSYITDSGSCSDQFCSLIFTLSNLYFIPCAYSHGDLAADWQRCSSKNPLWGIPFLLACLPLLARAVQSVKRWYDSRLPTHLINVRPPYILITAVLMLHIQGGKYAAGMIYYLSYFIWRTQGESSRSMPTRISNCTEMLLRWWKRTQFCRMGCIRYCLRCLCRCLGTLFRSSFH